MDALRPRRSIAGWACTACGSDAGRQVFPSLEGLRRHALEAHDAPLSEPRVEPALAKKPFDLA